MAAAAILNFGKMLITLDWIKISCIKISCIKLYGKMPHGDAEMTTHSLTAAIDQLRVVASSTSNDPGPRSR